MNPTIISVFSAVAAAAWSVWTWQSERQKVREQERNEMSAQYVNPFIIATQELQRQLYEIIECGELARHKSELEESPSEFAVELLYYMSNFFGWSLVTFRFGPYTRDPRMISIMARIPEVLESRSAFSGEAFCFNLAERIALGEASISRVGDNQHGPAFAVISCFKFEEELRDPKSNRVLLFRSREVQCSLQAIDRAIAGEELEGRDRLAALQNLLVDLLTYLEKEEGFRVSFGERGRAHSSAGHSPGDLDHNGNRPALHLIHGLPGRVRIGVSRLRHDLSCADKLKSKLASLEYVSQVRVNRPAACLVIDYAENVPESQFVKSVMSLLADELNESNAEKAN